MRSPLGPQKSTGSCPAPGDVTGGTDACSDHPRGAARLRPGKTLGWEERHSAGGWGGHDPITKPSEEPAGHIGGGSRSPELDN